VLGVRRGALLFLQNCNDTPAEALGCSLPRYGTAVLREENGRWTRLL